MTNIKKKLDNYKSPILEEGCINTKNISLTLLQTKGTKKEGKKDEKSDEKSDRKSNGKELIEKCMIKHRSINDFRKYR